MNRLDLKQFNEVELSIIKELQKEDTLYNSALQEIKTKIEILRDDFRVSNAYNPIEHIKMRIKQPASILKKVYLRGIDLECETIKRELTDIVGIRVVCTFKSDIYKIAEILSNLEDIQIIQIKDYISTPKESGYQSYHMIVKVPVHMIKGKVYCKVEIQLRTMAMDFWASLEHKIKYKYERSIPKEIKDELFDCSKIVDSLDDKMLKLHKKVHNSDSLYSDIEIEI